MLAYIHVFRELTDYYKFCYASGIFVGNKTDNFGTRIRRLVDGFHTLNWWKLLRAILYQCVGHAIVCAMLSCVYIYVYPWKGYVTTIAYCADNFRQFPQFPEYRHNCLVLSVAKGDSLATRIHDALLRLFCFLVTYVMYSLRKYNIRFISLSLPTLMHIWKQGLNAIDDIITLLNIWYIYIHCSVLHKFARLMPALAILRGFPVNRRAYLQNCWSIKYWIVQVPTFISDYLQSYDSTGSCTQPTSSSLHSCAVSWNRLVILHSAMQACRPTCVEQRP